VKQKRSAEETMLGFLSNLNLSIYLSELRFKEGFAHVRTNGPTIIRPIVRRIPDLNIVLGLYGLQYFLGRFFLHPYTFLPAPPKCYAKTNLFLLFF